MKRYDKRLRKAWAKPYGARSANAPTKGWATPYNQRAFSGMRETDTVLRMFGLDLGQGSIPRHDIVKRLNSKLLDVQLEHHICLEHNLVRKLFMFYCLAKNKYYFVCVEYEGRRIRTSRIYGTRGRALWLYNQDPVKLTYIHWEEDDWINGKETVEVFP